MTHDIEALCERLERMSDMSSTDNRLEDIALAAAALREQAKTITDWEETNRQWEMLSLVELSKERDRLVGEKSEWRNNYQMLLDDSVYLRTELGLKQHEIDALRKDAERYRWIKSLRNRQLTWDSDNIVCVGKENLGDLDAVADAHIAALNSPQEPKSGA